MGNSAKAGMIILVCGILGLILCGVFQIAYTNGFYLDQFITSDAELAGVQIMVIVLFLLAGGALGAISE